jgi:hypothetical protein
VSQNFIVFLCSLLLSYSVLYFLVRIRIAKCVTNSSKRFACQVMFLERAHFLLVSTLSSHLRILCAPELSCSLVTRVSLTRMTRGGWECLEQGVWTYFWFHFCTVVRYCCWAAFKWYAVFYREAYVLSLFFKGLTVPCHHKLLPFIYVRELFMNFRGHFMRYGGILNTVQYRLLQWMYRKCSSRMEKTKNTQNVTPKTWRQGSAWKLYISMRGLY